MNSKKNEGLVGYSQIAGNLCLDFINTLGGDRRGTTQEYLGTYSDLIAWGKAAGCLSKRTANDCLKNAEKNPDTSGEILDKARVLREAAYRVVTASLYRRPPSQPDLFLISKEATFAMGRAKLTAANGSFYWEWPESNCDLDRILWPVARSASDLLTSPEVARVRECASETCTWVFLDTSKNHTRRWCAMKDCGNREKARRHRQR
jgi:predicted RNA-binding Zn ribbon-like protein